MASGVTIQVPLNRSPIPSALEMQSFVSIEKAYGHVDRHRCVPTGHGLRFNRGSRGVIDSGVDIERAIVALGRFPW
jgi:hypothetical protein